MGATPGKPEEESSAKKRLNTNASAAEQLDAEDMKLLNDAEIIGKEAKDHDDPKTDGEDKTSEKKHGVLKNYASVESTSKGKHKKNEKDPVKISVTIKGASNLRNADFLGRSDPYCVMEIRGKHKDKPKVREQTQVVDDTRDPQWNFKFTCHCALGDALHFTVLDKDVMTDEVLGRCSLLPASYYPFGFVGDMRLQDTGENAWAHLTVSIKVLVAAQEINEEEIPSDEKYRGAGLWAGINFEEDNMAWKRAHDVVNNRDEQGMQKEETNASSIETLIRLAESGLPVPKIAMERIIACLHAPEKRYRLASLMICKALGSRCIPFEEHFGKLLHDQDDDIQAGAMKVIASFGDRASPYVDTMGKLLHDEVPVVRDAALEALGILSQADNFEALVVLGEGLGHEDKRYRLATCLILKTLEIKATPHAYTIVNLIQYDPSIDVRIAACTTLGFLGLGAEKVKPAIGELYISEHDEDPRVSRASTAALERLRQQGVQLPHRPKSGVGSEPPQPKAKSKAKARPKSQAMPDGKGKGKGKGKEKGKLELPKQNDSPRDRSHSPRHGNHKHKDSPRDQKHGSHKQSHKHKDKHDDSHKGKDKDDSQKKEKKERKGIKGLLFGRS